MDLAVRGKTPPPGEMAAGRSPPSSSAEREEALALGVAHLGIGVRVEEDVLVVERGHELEVAGEEHAVAEDVAGHVADADHRDVRRLHVDPELPEVPLDRLPGPARGDAHRLVVVAGRSPGGEGVPEPEPVLGGDAVRDVGERRGPLVGGHHRYGSSPS